MEPTLIFNSPKYPLKRIDPLSPGFSTTVHLCVGQLVQYTYLQANSYTLCNADHVIRSKPFPSFSFQANTTNTLTVHGIDTGGVTGSVFIQVRQIISNSYHPSDKNQLKA